MLKIDSLFFAISISESFNSYLNGIYEAENANVSEFIKAEWRNEKIQKFKDVLLDENREEQTRQYAFIDISLMTPEVMEIIQRQKFQT
ncbi:hypothetical protein [Flavonifractor sp. An10]|uniref:hypothetical protein n=1 Tax=Flavonifractor sp. An10 TaxID=1965537 RepID=UPI000B368849|nr:hypothetical protein [Flavonifractor sp. An10]OUQ82666.1 hypothetical protein B5E42_08215 [Flavonifractor sp. An10]